jgi:hypothetical protein
MMRTAALIALLSIALPLAAADSSGSKPQQAKSNETTSAPAEATEKAASPAQQPTVLGAGDGPESPLVAAARSANRGKSKSTIVITNSTLANNTGGHFSVAPGSPVLKTAKGGTGVHPAPTAVKPPDGTVTGEAEVRAKAEKAKLDQAKAEIARLEAEKARRLRMAQASEELMEGNADYADALEAAAAKANAAQATETSQAKPPM